MIRIMTRKSLPLSRMLNHINQMTAIISIMRIANIKLERKNILMKQAGQKLSIRRMMKLRYTLILTIRKKLA